jgi:hypothetical protein
MRKKPSFYKGGSRTGAQRKKKVLKPTFKGRPSPLSQNPRSANVLFQVIIRYTGASSQYEDFKIVLCSSQEQK